MTSLPPLIGGTGPAYDLEASYIQKPQQRLHTPSLNIPFGLQGAPLPDPLQVHTGKMQMYQMTKDVKLNPLPFTVWHGTSSRQINQPQFLGVNEKR